MIRDRLKNCALAIPVVLTISDLVGTAVHVEGSSMRPTLNPEGSVFNDWVLVEKISYKWLHQYQRGDVAILWAPDNPHMQLMKRIVALPGDIIWDDAEKSTQRIQQGRCWIEGDNKSASGDSRNLYGQVHLGLLEGRVMCVIWPPWRIGRVPSFIPPGRVFAVEA